MVKIISDLWVIVSRFGKGVRGERSGAAAPTSPPSLKGKGSKTKDSFLPLPFREGGRGVRSGEIHLTPNPLP